jgi:putative drug exporter of the RND superfamily
MTERVVRACASRPWRVLGGWVLALVASVLLIATFLGEALTNTAEVTTLTDSKRANQLLTERIGSGTQPSEALVVRSPALTADDSAFRDQLQRLRQQALATGVLDKAAMATVEELPVSPDGHAVLLPLPLHSDDIEPVVELVDAADGQGGFDVELIGEATADRDLQELADQDLRQGELLFGLPAAIVVLLLVFGSLVAGLVPLLLAIMSIVVAVALAALVGQGFALSVFVVNMITGMGLALGIDYSLFVLSRYREERAGGRAVAEAIGTAGATASRSVLFSGLAFVLAMVGMVLVPDTILRSLAVGAILVGVVSVVAALTLLPALLGLLGDRVNALRLPIVGRGLGRGRGAEGRFWSRVVQAVVRRPVAGLVLSAGLLLVLAVPVGDLERGFAGISTLPDRFPSKQGLLALEASFPGATTEPAKVVIHGQVTSPEVKAAIDRLRRDLDGRGRFGPATLDENDAGDLAVLSVPVGADAQSTQAYAAVRQLRQEFIPAAFAGVDARVLVTGDSAENLDYFAIIGRWLPLVFVFVLGLSFLLLVLAFRTIVVPAVAILLNLLSVGAAYGLVVGVFQHGWGADLLGLQRVDAVEAWVPLFLFAVLFGLSMDYQVFLLSRIHERYRQTGDPRGAVVVGVGSTARIITGAALIIVAVFCGFAAGDLVMFQQMGFGVAVSLLLDATIIRSVLMPATLAVLGHRAWWLPRWLGWLPRLTIEPPATSGPGAPAPASEPGREAGVSSSSPAESARAKARSPSRPRSAYDEATSPAGVGTEVNRIPTEPPGSACAALRPDQQRRLHGTNL